MLEYSTTFGVSFDLEFILISLIFFLLLSFSPIISFCNFKLTIPNWFFSYNVIILFVLENNNIFG